MNKLFTKIAALSVGLAMAIGVGVAVGGGQAKRAEAATGDVTITIDKTTVGSYASGDKTVTKTVATANDLSISIKGTKTKKDASATTDYTYIMFNKNEGYAYSTTCPTNYYPSKVTVTFSSSTGETGKAGINYGANTITSRNSSVNGSVSKSGTCELTNSDTTKLHWNFSTTGANVQVDSIAIVYSLTSGGGTPQLSTPSPIFNKSAGTITWEGITGAQTYMLSLDGGTATSQTSPYTLPANLSVAQHTVSIVAKGTGYDDSNAGSVTFHKTSTLGTEQSPYTVADAKLAIDDNAGLANVYASGIVSQVDSYNDNFHSITYWISADGTTTNQLEVFGGKNLNNTDFNSVNDLQVGDIVTVYGSLTKYNSVYEFSSNNYLTSFSRPADPDDAKLDSLVVTADPVLHYYSDATSSEVDYSNAVIKAHYTSATDSGWSKDYALTNSDLDWTLNMATLKLTVTYTDQADDEASYVWDVTDDGARPLYVEIDFTNSTSRGNAVTARNADPSVAENCIVWPDSSSIALNEFYVGEVGFAASNTSGSNTGKWYVNGYDWRFYENEDGKVIINTSNFYVVDKVTFTFTVNNTGILKYGNTTLTSGTAVDVTDAASVEFYVDNSGTATNGRINITKIKVEYVASTTPIIEAECGSELTLLAGASASTYTVNYYNLSSETQVVVSYSKNNVVTASVTNWVLSITPGNNADTVTVTLTASTATYEINIEVIEADQYTKVIDVDQLYQGQKVIIGSTDGAKALGPQKTNNQNVKTNREAVTTAHNGNVMFIDGESTATVFTLGILEETDGTIHYSFYDGSNYICAGYKSGENYLSNVGTNTSDNGALFTISVTNAGVATVVSNGTNNRNVVRFNSGSSLFAAYETSGTASDIALYVNNDDVTNAQIVSSFVVRHMKMESIPTSNVGSTSACAANWTAASTAYAKLDSTQQEMFVKGTFVNPSNTAPATRLSYWAAANGSTLNMTTGALSANSNVGGLHSAEITGANATTAIIVIASVTLLGVGGYFFIRKKKEQ